MPFGHVFQTMLVCLYDKTRSSPDMLDSFTPTNIFHYIEIKVDI